MLPADSRRVEVWGVAALGGIGFTVSLFIAELAFDGSGLEDDAKVGIFGIDRERRAGRRSCSRRANRTSPSRGRLRPHAPRA